MEEDFRAWKEEYFKIVRPHLGADADEVVSTIWKPKFEPEFYTEEKNPEIVKEALAFIMP